MSEHNPTELNNSNNEEPRIAGELGAILENTLHELNGVVQEFYEGSVELEKEQDNNMKEIIRKANEMKELVNLLKANREGCLDAVGHLHQNAGNKS